MSGSKKLTLLFGVLTVLLALYGWWQYGIIPPPWLRWTFFAIGALQIVIAIAPVRRAREKGN